MFYSRLKHLDKFRMKVAIIGAGHSGLAALKYGKEKGHECDVFEQKEELGGLWVYKEKIAKNVLEGSPMYKGLLTNLPKDLMELADYPYQETSGSYLTHPEVAKYLNRFADHFDLRKYIRCHNRVLEVEPLPNQKWGLRIENVLTNEEKYLDKYDAVFVCSGRQRLGFIPVIPGQDLFLGKQTHTIDFREQNIYKDKRVLVVGCGPSAFDIARLILKVTPWVYISSNQDLGGKAPKIIKKGKISHFESERVAFEDGTKLEIDDVLYGTGYRFYFPFLSEKCGVRIENNWVKPLYKHIINAKHPSMYFIGVPSDTLIIPMIDLQVRYAYAALNGKFHVPPKEKMSEEIREYFSDEERKSLPPYHSHKLSKGPEQTDDYFASLAEESGEKPIRPVLIKIFKQIKFGQVRFPMFTIVDDHNFVISS